MGDGGSGGDPENRAQNLKSRLGKLLRIDPTRAGSAWQIVGYGLRNPWRFSFDRANGNLWIGDVGQDRYEEIDYRNALSLGALANYGWAASRAGRVRRRQADMCARATLVCAGARLPALGRLLGHRRLRLPRLRGAVDGGRYVYGDYCSGTVWSFKAGSGRLSAATVAGNIHSLSSFGEDGNGELYATSLDGTVYRLR